MKVTAAVVVDSRVVGSERVWEWTFNGMTLLDHALTSLEQTPAIDECFVFTDIDDILEKYGQEKAVPFLERFSYNFNYLDNTKLHTEKFSIAQADRLGEVHFFLNVTNPLIGPAILEGMYHKLLETRLASKVIPTYAIDPHLIMQVGESGTYMRLWDQPGLDRQLQPQLMRITGACVVHCERVTQSQPVTIHYPISRSRGLTVGDADELKLAQYIFDKSAEERAA